MSTVQYSMSTVQYCSAVARLAEQSQENRTSFLRLAMEVQEESAALTLTTPSDKHFMALYEQRWADQRLETCRGLQPALV